MKSYNRFRKFIFLLFSILFLLSGSLNYILIKPRINLNLNGITSILLVLRIFIKNHFSDVAWCIALCFIILFLKEIKKLDSTGYVFLISIPFLTELLQFLEISGGTFDWVDIFFYLVVIIIFELMFKLMNYEKSD